MTSSYAQKNECLKNLKLLNRNLKLAEKDVYMNISSIRNDKEFQAAFETNLMNDNNHKCQRSEFALKLRKISQMIKKLKEETSTTKPTQQALDILKTIMEDIDTSISDFKQHNNFKYEEFLSDEKFLTKEIEIYEKKIHNWSKQNDTDTNNPKSINQNDLNSKLSECDLLKEVVDFDKYLLQNGGHNGGWEEIDHNLFLRIRNKHKTQNEAYFDELERLIVTKTRNQIDQHENWYTTYLALKELKKEAIKKWKENKKNNKNETVNLADAELKLNQEIEKELKHRIEKQKQLDKQQRNKQLNEWRIEREIKKAQEIQQERLKEAKQLEKEFKEHLKKAEIKEKLNEYKKQRAELNEYIEMEQFLLRETEKEIRTREIKAVISNFQERDFEKVREKQEKLRAKQEVLLEKEKRLEKCKEKFQVDSDPTRLYKPTSTWQNRVNTPRSESATSLSSRFGSIVQTPRVQHLMVPTWRQGI